MNRIIFCKEELRFVLHKRLIALMGIINHFHAMRHVHKISSPKFYGCTVHKSKPFTTREFFF